MAKAPRPGAGKRAQEAQRVYKVTLDGDDHYLRMAEVTAIDTGELRRQTGFGLRHLGYALLADPDIDIIAAVVWLCRRQAGEPGLSLDVVAGAITYETVIGIDIIDEKAAAESEPDSPEG